MFKIKNNDKELKLGTLCQNQRKKKDQQNILRTITLMEVIRKILSKIFINRTDAKINKFLSNTQSAYRKGRSTTTVSGLIVG